MKKRKKRKRKEKAHARYHSKVSIRKPPRRTHARTQKTPPLPLSPLSEPPLQHQTPAKSKPPTVLHPPRFRPLQPSALVPRNPMNNIQAALHPRRRRILLTLMIAPIAPPIPRVEGNPVRVQLKGSCVFLPGGRFATPGAAEAGEGCFEEGFLCYGRAGAGLGGSWESGWWVLGWWGGGG